MASTVDAYVLRASKAEKEIETLLAEIKNLEKNPTNGSSSSDDSPIPEELEKLQVENRKLKYRLGVLQRSTAEQSQGGNKMATANKRSKIFDPKTTMPSIMQLLVDIFSAAVEKAYPDLGPNVPCPVALSSTQADYQFNGAMAINGLLKVTRFFNPVVHPQKIRGGIHQTAIFNADMISF